MEIRYRAVELIVIDSFCGAGGVTEGFHRARYNGELCSVVVIGINHDEQAIYNHSLNHPETTHFIEDFTTLNPEKLLPILESAKKLYPNAKVMFWMSAECTHHSKAKGGESRDADSRSLPEHAYRYIEILNPDIIGVENVVEFLDWGPVDIKVVKNKQGNELYCPIDVKKNKKSKKITVSPVYVPVKELKGIYYEAWRDTIISYGYHYDYKKLNAADYGAYTSRTRYFGYFSKDKNHIAFPHKTHSKTGKDGLKKWRPVKDVLDLSIEGESIFNRSKPLVEATLERILSGLIKFVAGGKDKWLLKYNSVNKKNNLFPEGHICPARTITSAGGNLGLVNTCFLSKYYSGSPEYKNITVDGPAGTITTVDSHALINCCFLHTYYGNGGVSSVSEPSPTITTKDRCALVDARFLVNSYSGGGKIGSIENPSPVVSTVPKQNIIKCEFIDQQYGKSKAASVECPIGTLTANPKHNVVSCWIMNTNFGNIGSSIEAPSPTVTANRKYHYLLDTQYNRIGREIDVPCFTLIARMDKTPPYLMEASRGENTLPSFIKINGNLIIYEIYNKDSPKTKEIKEFMALYGLTDIKMRMLMVKELGRIMGFGDNYLFKGTQTNIKKFIGNAVECTQSRVNAEAICEAIVNN